MPAGEGFVFNASSGGRTKGRGGTMSNPTPLPMSVDPSTAAEDPDYKDSVNGVLPGYSGHMPRARDKYAGSAHGGLANPYTPPDAKGPQKGCTRPEDVIPSTFESYLNNVQGVVPGYTGYRPKAHDVFNVTAFGGVPEKFADGAHERTFEWARKPEEAPASFRDTVGGVLPGYKGFVPGAIEKHGTSHYGKTRGDIPLAQNGHAEQYTTKESNVAFYCMPGYEGHVPQSRDAYGQSTHGAR